MPPWSKLCRAAHVGLAALLGILMTATSVTAQTSRGMKLFLSPSAAAVLMSTHVANLQPVTPNPQAEAEGEAYFHKAVTIARRQGARMLELRTSVSLARLWQQQGRKRQARHLLAKICSWFTEGFDTADLQDAKTLLGDLS
jgi:hypothetical protein